jgi:hypothetical protein
MPTSNAKLQQVVSNKLLHPIQAMGLGQNIYHLFHAQLKWAKHNFLLLRNMVHASTQTFGNEERYNLPFCEVVKDNKMLIFL